MSKKTRKMRHALLMSVISMMLCCAMLVGTTFAWFTDEVSSEGNIIKSGTLEVEMSWTDKYPTDSTVWNDASKGAIFNYQYWEPGYTEVRYVKIANVGSLALKYQLNVIPAVLPAEGEVNLADVIDVYIANPAVTLDRDAVNKATPVGTLSDLMADTDGAAYGILLPTNGSSTVTLAPEDADIAAKGEVIVAIALKMQESAGNEYQDKSVGEGFRVQLRATQYTYENDSFDNQYDNIALVSDAAALADAIAAGKNVMLTNDVALDVNGKAMTVAAGADVIIDLNGNDIIGTTTASGASQVLFEVKGELTVVGDGTIALHDKSDAAFNQGYENAAIYVNGGVANLNGGMIVCTSSGEAMAYAADAVGGNSVINVNGATLYSSYIGIRSFPTASGKTNTINYNSGVVYGGKNGYDIWTQEGNGTSVVNIADGIGYKHEDQWGGMYYINDDVAYVSTSTGLTAALEKGNNAILTADIALTEANMTAEVGNVNYAFMIGDGKTVTIDLNGHTLSANYTVENGIAWDQATLVYVAEGGSLTITDSVGTGKMTFNTNIPCDDYQSSWGVPVINKGTLVVNGGSIESLVPCPTVGPNGETEYTEYGIVSPAVDNFGSLTLNGGTIYSVGHNAVRNFGSIVMNGGLMKSDMFVAVDGETTSTVEINGGELDGGKTTSIIVRGTATVTGGFFNEKISPRDGSTLTVTGGTFAADPSDYVADGYVATETNGVWTVTAK